MKHAHLGVWGHLFPFLTGYASEGFNIDQTMGLFFCQIISSMPANRAVSYYNFLHTQIVLLYAVCAADDKGVWGAVCGGYLCIWKHLFRIVNVI